MKNVKISEIKNLVEHPHLFQKDLVDTPTFKELYRVTDEIDSVKIKMSNEFSDIVSSMNVISTIHIGITKYDKMCVCVYDGIYGRYNCLCDTCDISYNAREINIKCRQQNDTSIRFTIFLKEKEPIIKSMALCENRHNITQAVHGSIFPQTINPLDICAMESMIINKLEGVKVLNLYVTGLTVALVEVIKYCELYNIELVLYHYDKDTNTYYPQRVN